MSFTEIRLESVVQRGGNRATIKVPLEEYMQVRGESSLTKSDCYSWWNSKSENIWKPKLKNAKSRLRPARHTSFANILAWLVCLIRIFYIIIQCLLSQ